MSANILLVNGQINPALVPASVVPQQPTFQTLTISPPAGFDGRIAIESESGVAELLKNDSDPTFSIVNDNDRFITHNSTGAGTATFGSANAVGVVTIAAVDNANVTAPIVALGKSSASNPSVIVVGATGNGTVYDTKYNPIGAAYSVLINNQLLTTASPLSGTYTVPKTGLYSVSFTIKLDNASTIGDNHLDMYFNQYNGSPTCFSALPSTMAYSASSTANEFTFNGIAYLTATATVAYGITGWGDGWSVRTYLSVAPIC